MYTHYTCTLCYSSICGEDYIVIFAFSFARYARAKSMNPCSLRLNPCMSGGTLSQLVLPVLDNERNHFCMVVPVLMALLEEFSELSLFFICRTSHLLF